MKTQTIYVFGTIVGAGILYAAYKKLKVREIVYEIPTKWRAIGKLQSLHMHILKNGQEYEIREGVCTKYGLVKKINGVEWRDQSILVYDPKSMEIKSSQQYPVILTITVKPMPWKKFGLSSPDQEEILINLPELIEQTKLNIPNKNCWDCGDEAANFISKIIPKQIEGLRLCYHDYSKSTNTIYHLINKNSVETLNKQLEIPVSEHYFRPNFFVFGHHIQPWEEESWKWVKIGAAVFKNLKSCEKSKEVGDEKTKKKVELLKMNKKNHCCDGCPEVGIYLETYIEGIVHVHDQVFVN
ncbi:uncharacterized protein [Onthophagus taurus]|uniref:uncharacterized protein n=1 Tax=Onthophagus taurus TaxID=166361 RepID=UPI000C20A62C|nr:uncharacterized protein LOC111426382 [Onthophagus taurus]